MLLDELYKLGLKIDMPYGMSKYRSIDLIVTIDENGNVLEYDETRERDVFLSCATRGTNILPNFLYDNEEYVIDSPATHNKFQAFIDYHQKAYDETNSSNLKILLDFYENGGSSKLAEMMQKINAETKGDKEQKKKIGFRIKVDNSYLKLHTDPELIKYYAKDFEATMLDSIKSFGQCSITGLENQPLISTSQRKVGGFGSPAPSTGVAIYSNNLGAVAVKKRDQLLSSNISLEADRQIVKALDYLLHSKRNNLKLKSTTFLYWTDQTLEDAFDLDQVLSENPNQDDINNFIKSYKYDTKFISKIDNVDCHLVEIDVSTTRPYYKYYKLHLSEIYKNLVDWYNSIYNFNRYESIRSLLSESVDKNANMDRIREDLIRCAIFGDKPSQELISQINQRNFADRGPIKNNKYTYKRITLANAILEKYNMTENNAYIFGRMLKFADLLSEKSVGKTNTRFSSNFYNAKNLNSAFSQVDNKIRTYIEILKRKEGGLGYYYESFYNKNFIDAIDFSSMNKSFTALDNLMKSKGFASQIFEKNEIEGAS